jgi:hypothetical protein
MENRNKKLSERWLIEEARRRSTIFPPGELSAFESPDWLIRDAFLGIEVTDLLPPKRNSLYSGAQLSAFQAEIVQRARAQYFTECASDADVLVFFENEWNRKREAQAYAVSLAQFVRRNLPVDRDCVTLQARHAKDWVEGISVIRISRTGNKWLAAGAAGIPLLEYTDLAARIAAKNKLLPRYRARLPEWKMWLLMATDIRVLRSVGIPPDITDWRFSFDFEKVLLMPWDGEVVELARQ